MRPITDGVAQGVAAEIRRVVGDHLGSAVANTDRRSDRGQGVLKSRVRPLRVPPRDRRHRPIGDLDPAETVATGEIDAGSEVPVGTDQATAQVFGIAEAAEGLRFEFDRTACTRQLNALLMLGQAASMSPRGK